MNNNDHTIKVIKAIASSPLFMEKGGAINLMNRYNSIMSSGILQSETLTSEYKKKAEELTAVSFHSAAKNVVTGKLGSQFEGVPSGSIAVVPVMGVMSRDSYCTLSEGFVSGTRDLEKTIQMLDANENVDGIVFYINTPGGQASGNESVANIIQSCKTPTVGFFEMMASAGVGAFQGVDELYAAESSSQWGSIGTYISFYDDKRFFEEMGFDLIEIYAPQSTEKNKDFREAFDGNNKPMEERLEKMTANFIKQVKKARPSIKDDGKVFKGKIYNAVEAQKIGAIDGIKNLNFAIDRARYLFKNGKGKKKSNAAKNQSETMSEENNKKVGFFEKLFPGKSTEQAEKDVESVETRINSLKEENKTIKAVAVEKEAELTTLQASNTELEDKVKALESEAKQTIEKLEGVEVANKAALEGTEFENVQELADDYKKVVAHNLELGGKGAAGTPVDNQQNVSNSINSTITKPLTIAQQADAIEAEIAAEEKAKAEAKK